MKGVVFNLLEAFICEGWDAATYEAILAACSLQTKEPFVGPGTYPDSDLFLIAGQAAETLGLPLPAALRAFGRYLFPRLAEQVLPLVKSHADARSFLKSVEDVIHVEVRKLMPQAITPSFHYREPDARHLVIEYRSARKLCALMEGLLDGTADFFATTIGQQQTRCLLRGDECCEFQLEFADPSGKAA
jgi:hypothetical protein